MVLRLSSVETATDVWASLKQLKEWFSGGTAWFSKCTDTRNSESKKVVSVAVTTSPPIVNLTEESPQNKSLGVSGKDYLGYDIVSGNGPP